MSRRFQKQHGSLPLWLLRGPTAFGMNTDTQATDFPSLDDNMALKSRSRNSSDLTYSSVGDQKDTVEVRLAR